MQRYDYTFTNTSSKKKKTFLEKKVIGQINVQETGILIVMVLFSLSLIMGTVALTGKKKVPAVLPAQNVTQPDTQEQPEPEKTFMFRPYCVDSTAPSNLGIKTSVQVNGTVLSAEAKYERKDKIFFKDDCYTDLNGIITFRGNNYRAGATYSDADITNMKLSAVAWTQDTKSLKGSISSTAYWTGNGWTGQPLIVKWPQETKKIMNLYPEAKEKTDLTEVIYASMDGYIYFIDLETGKYTRDAVYIGFPFKGAGALDPRGIPILYVGSGDNSPKGGCSRIFIISLIDGIILDQIGYNDSFAPRSWYGYDSSALVSADTDTLIYPGENGVIYTVKLNTNYNKETGTLSVNPSDTVKFKYTTKRSGNSKYWLGMESSAAALGEYLIICDNAGDLLCININTFDVIWAQDVLDDTNCSPVIEIEEDGKAYIYLSTSLHWTAKNGRGMIPIWKIDAQTGEIVWKTEYPCSTVNGLSGGVQGTIALGKNSLSDYIYVPVSRTPGKESGLLAALDKKTGKEVWSYETSAYSWSSPCDFYDKTSGRGYIIHCDTGGNVHLLDGLTGQVYDTIKLNGIIEASPSVYGNYMVLGTRAQKIYGICLT